MITAMFDNYDPKFAAKCEGLANVILGICEDQDLEVAIATLTACLAIGAAMANYQQEHIDIVARDFRRLVSLVALQLGEPESHGDDERT